MWRLGAIECTIPYKMGVIRDGRSYNMKWDLTGNSMKLLRSR